ncbi:MAG: carbohydrate ABC transporter permease [Chloroflexota bacterium]|nr:carbohydrate ABC transporter permease [Chloroflexota bacterium]
MNQRQQSSTVAGDARPLPREIAVATEQRRRRIGRQRLINRTLLYLVASLLGLFILIPIYFITIAAFSPREAIFAYPKELIPSQLSTTTLAFFAGSTGVLDALLRSVVVAVVTLTLSLVLGAPAGYAIARYAFRGRDAFRLVILSTRAFPIVILSIPLAVTFIQWGIYDTIWAVALMHTALAMPFAVLITSSIFVSVPRELEEAAQTLGCHPVQAFFRVVLPLALPGLAAAALFTFVLSWNEVFAAVILTLRERTLPAHVLSVLAGSPPPFKFAGAFFLLIPSLIVIFFIRRYLLGLWGRVVK